MGGIAGILDLCGSGQVGRAELAAMLLPLQKRGPAGNSYCLGAGIGLAQAQFDLGGAADTPPVSKQDWAIQVVCSSQIFNAAALRDALGLRGHHVAEGDDAALLTALYHVHGDDFVQQLNGQFAFALWDRSRRRLLLARDRPGIVPLHFAELDGRLLFASEIKALLPLFEQAPALDPVALDQLFTFWATQAPRTMFRGVQQLPPGEMLIVESGRYRRKRYWDWSFPQAQAEYHQTAPGELAEQLRYLLADAVRVRQQPAPVGAYLSGGLDSSALVALMKHESGVAPQTFSIRFEDKALDESGHQQRMADHVGSRHRFVRCGYADVGERFPEVIRQTESPVLRTAPTPMAMLSELVRREGFKAVLTGEGADEVFGGYDIFKEAKIRQFWAKQPQSGFRPLLLKRLYPYLSHSQQGLVYLQQFFGKELDRADHPFFSHLLRWATTAMCKRFFSDEFLSQLDTDALTLLEQELPAAMPDWAPMCRAQYLEAKLLLPGYLLSMQGDRMLMANSVVGRFPFLDHRVIEFAARLPPHLKMRVLDEKYLLKRALKQHLPADILGRHKQPYRSPDIAAFFSGPVPDYVMELLGENALRRSGYFNLQRVAQLIEKIRMGRAIGAKDNMAFVGILSTQLWHHLFVEQHHAAARCFRSQDMSFQYGAVGV
jgi:asparagine synthase (glutamine-hydrolysing)